MFKITKNYVLDENQKPIAVQIPIEDFTKLEEVLENFGLVKLMAETENDDLLAGEEAYNYYQSLKKDSVES